MIDKETWKTGTDCDKMENLTKYNMHVQYHKSVFLKKNFPSNVKNLLFFSWMVAFKTNLDIIGKFKWIGKMTYNIIKSGLANTLLHYIFLRFFLIIETPGFRYINGVDNCFIISCIFPNISFWCQSMSFPSFFETSFFFR